MSSTEREIDRKARFPIPEVNGQVPSQYSLPCMWSLFKRYNVSKLYEANVLGQVYEIDVMDNVHEVDVTRNSVKEGPLDNVSIFNQEISLAPPQDTPLSLYHTSIYHTSF